MENLLRINESLLLLGLKEDTQRLLNGKKKYGGELTYFIIPCPIPGSLKGSDSTNQINFQVNKLRKEHESQITDY